MPGERYSPSGSNFGGTKEDKKMNLNNYKTVFFIGIGGMGMRAH